MTGRLLALCLLLAASVPAQELPTVELNASCLLGFLRFAYRLHPTKYEIEDS
jgi:hypothetical protein